MSDLLDKYKKSSPTSSLANKYKPSSKKAAEKKGKSPFGFIKNVAGDIRDITVEAGPAIYETGKAVAKDVKDLSELVTNPRPKQGKEVDPLPRTKKIVRAIGKSYAETYGPLVQGDFDKFLENVYNDPVYIGLDALTLASLGVTAPVKVGILPAKGGKILEITTASGKTVSKPLAKGELRARLQSLGAKRVDGRLVKEDKGVVVRGRELRAPGVKAAKIERTRLTRKDANVRAQNIAFENALRKNKGQPAKVAAALLGRFDRQALDEYAALLRASDEASAKATLKIITNPRVQALFNAPTPRVKRVLDEARGLGEKQKDLLGVDDATAEARRFRPAQQAGGAKFNRETGEWEGGPTIADLKGRGLDPIYFPDTSSVPRKGFAVGRGGGVGVPNKTGNMRQNRGSLMAAGQLILDPATLNESFLRSAKYAHYNDVHDSLIDLAEPVEYPRAGMVLIRKKRGERVAPKDRMRSDFEDWAATHLDAEGEFKGKDAGLTTESIEEAVTTPEGKYLAVPKKVADSLAGEFTRQNQFFYWMNRNPMRVWRALVLGLRPAYLVNNAVGNTLMYLMHSARPEELRQLAGAFKQFAKKSEGKEIDRLLERHFAGQVRGGFVASQMPEFSPGGKVKRGATAVVNVIPSIDKRWEQALRRAKVKAELKRHPELRKHATRMGKENAYFEKIAPGLDENPEIVTQVYDRVNDALGNYDSMSAVERGAIRNLFPFYAWYKAITLISLKLAIEQPLKINLIANLGRIAAEANLEKAGWNKDEIPSSLLGFIPTKREGNRVRGFNTASLNPFATMGQLADFAVSPLEGPGAMGPKLPGANPLMLEIISYIYGQNPAGYGVPEVPGVGVIDALPQNRLAGAAERKYGYDIPFVKPAPDGDTFNDRDVVDELLRFLGVPYARVSPSAAKRVVDR